LISPTAEYALRAVVAIAQGDGKAVVTPTLVEMTKVPAGYLPKVLQTLRRAGIVNSKRGLGGGFTLARSPELVTVLDVVNTVDPIKRIERCPLGVDSHSTILCPLHKRLDEAAEMVEKSFASTTIAELLATDANHAPLCKPAKPITLDSPPEQ
jgi:Rrf2 family transcriptional regulator, nitric oxide-sensitive transcriptional repressor